MRILQTSDSHLGITNRKAIKKMLEKAAQEDFDVILHCGDYCGGRKGFKTVRATVELIREFFPDKPFVSVLGNHDYWYEGRKKPTSEDNPTLLHNYIPKRGFPSVRNYQYNLNKIKECFKKNTVHFLDEDGLYQHPDFPNVVLMGHSGWYKHTQPPTNDINFLPYMIEGNTNSWMERNARNAIFRQMDELDKIHETFMTICFVSHFPVVNSVEDHKESFHKFCWDEAIQTMLVEAYNCKYFFCGHAHKHCTGPLRYESGSDYYNPKYHIVEV